MRWEPSGRAHQAGVQAVMTNGKRVLQIANHYEATDSLALQPPCSTSARLIISRSRTHAVLYSRFHLLVRRPPHTFIFRDETHDISNPCDETSTNEDLAKAAISFQEDPASGNQTDAQIIRRLQRKMRQRGDVPFDQPLVRSLS